MLPPNLCGQERHRIDVDCRRTDRTQPLFMVQSDDPAVDPEEEDGAQSRSNKHVDRIAEILLTYNFYEKELGMWRGTRLFTCHLLGIPGPSYAPFSDISYSRLCSRDVGSLRPFVRCMQYRRGVDVLVLRIRHEPDGELRQFSTGAGLIYLI